MINNTLRTYLEWRFKVNNHPKYQRYRDEWIEALLPVLIQYFEQERVRMIKTGLYKMSEPLTISDIIKLLNSIKEQYGDIKVGTWADGIVKFIRSVKYIKAENMNDEAALLQWWDE